jgi:hypothetical protein
MNREHFDAIIASHERCAALGVSSDRRLRWQQPHAATQ